MPRRKTDSQAAILNILRQDPAALSHDDISTKLNTTVNRVTIYRILNRFVEDGLVHRVVADDGRQYFASCEEGCKHDGQAHGHIHFRCVVCDRVECLPVQVDYQLPEGYRVSNHNIMLSGHCKDCEDPS